MNNLHKPSIFKASLLALLLTSAFSSHGASLGKLSVFSGIGQQLNAEVAIGATPSELGSMTVRLASREAFREAGIEYMPLLQDVRIDLDRDAAGQPILRLSSQRPISEPFLHFLVELSWTSGRMVREYTFLLDPPEMLQQARPASVAVPSTPAVLNIPPVPAVVTPGAKVVSPGQAHEEAIEYPVKQGDTLTRIARETRPESVTLDQVLVALFNGNREAFSGGNMNRLRAGKILRIPSAEEVSKVDSSAARKLFIKHAIEFNAYRNRLAGMARETQAAEVVPGQQVSGAIKPQVVEKVVEPVAKDKLEVSRTEPEKAAKPTVGSSIEEDLIARDKALREASERIALLEKNIENLKHLVEIKSQAGVKLQQQGETSQTKPVETTQPPPPVSAASPVPTEPATTTEVAKPPVPVKAPSTEDKKPVAPPPQSEPAFVDDNPEIVYGGGALIALLLAYLGYSSWRRKKSLSDEGADSRMAPFIATTPDDQAGIAPQVFEAPVTPQGSGEMSIQGDFSESAFLTNEEIVDPVAEADVLMAYGRDRQAEEILLEGLEKDPTRTAIHMKLLDLYSKQENLSEFETVAEKLHGLSKGRGAEWDRAVAIAHSLGLAGGIFGAAVDAFAPSSVSVVTPPPADSVHQDAQTAFPEAIGASEPSVADKPPPSLEFDLDLGQEVADSLKSEPVMESGKAVEMRDEDDFDPGSLVLDYEMLAEDEVATGAEEQTEPVLSELDFDLDLGSVPARSSPGDIPNVSNEGVAKAEEVAPDFDLGTPGTKEDAGAAAAQDKNSSDASQTDLSGLDFDLDLGSSDESVTEPDALPGQEQAAVPETPVAGGLGKLDLDFDLDLEPEQAPADTLPRPSPQGAATLATPKPMDSGEEEQGVIGEMESSSKPDDSEVDTKLELALAYEEMGDFEGARELLNEVLNEGSEAQQAKARAKLDQLNV